MAPKAKPKGAAEPAAGNNLIDRLFPLWNDAEVAADKGGTGAPSPCVTRSADAKAVKAQHS